MKLLIVVLLLVQGIVLPKGTTIHEIGMCPTVAPTTGVSAYINCVGR